MANQLLYINPSTRKRKSKGVRTMAKTRRTAAQRAATKKLIAFNKRRSGVRKRKPTTRRKNPSWFNNTPGHRRAALKGWRNRRKSTTTRKKRNPTGGGIMGQITSTIMPAMMAAGGGIGLDIVMGYLPIPENLKAGPMRHLTKAVGAVGIGIVGRMFLNPKTAHALATGALGITFYDAGREMLQRFVPQVKMAGLGMYEDYPMMGLGMYEDDLSQIPQTTSPSLGQYEDEWASSLGQTLEDELEI